MHDEPNLNDIEDYNGHESKEKRKTVNIIIIALILTVVVYSMVKFYYDRHTPESFNPVVEKHTSE